MSATNFCSSKARLRSVSLSKPWSVVLLLLPPPLLLLSESLLSVDEDAVNEASTRPRSSANRLYWAWKSARSCISKRCHLSSQRTAILAWSIHTVHTTAAIIIIIIMTRNATQHQHYGGELNEKKVP
jgi:hypothetical protein